METSYRRAAPLASRRSQMSLSYRYENELLLRDARPEGVDELQHRPHVVVVGLPVVRFARGFELALGRHRVEPDAIGRIGHEFGDKIDELLYGGLVTRIWLIL